MPSPFNKNAILKGDVAQMRALFAAASPPAQLSRLYRITAEQLVSTLLGGDQLDVVLAPLVERFKEQLITEATSNSYFYTDPLHPLRRLLDCFLQHACYWYPRDTKQQTLFLQQYQRLIESVALHSAVNSGGIWCEPGVFNDFNRWIEAEYKRAKLLESRVCQTAVNHLRLLEAECRVLNLINNSFAGKSIPTNAHSLIIGALKSELQYNLINAGHDSSFWLSWGKMLPELANIFHTSHDQRDTQYSSTTVPALLSDLQNSLQLSSSNPANYQLLVSRLSKLLSRTATQSSECVLFKALPHPEGHENFNNHNTQHIQTGIEEMKPGSWVIILSDEGQQIRCKLALKNTIANQLLFVDRSGRKVMTKSSEELLNCFKTGTAKRFTPISFHDFFSYLLDKLIAQASQLAKKQKPRTAAEQQTVCQKPKDVMQSNVLVEIQHNAARQKEGHQLSKGATKQTAVNKNREKALALAKEKHWRITAQIAKEDAKREQLIKLERAKEQAAALNVGAMVTIYKEEHASQRCKLAAIIAATGKYIFADSRGRKFAEYQYDQLIEAILENKLQVISSGDIFEDQLAKVIRGSR